MLNILNKTMQVPKSSIAKAAENLNLTRASIVAGTIVLSSASYAASDYIKKEPSESQPTIQVALLLDTSNSMDGLIDQAKSRLWNVVNTLTSLKYNGKEPRIQIALYEYGNDSLSRDKSWVKQVTPLTQDLDLISEKLFALDTNGGEEYAGAVIANATKTLKWSDGQQNMKLIYIAGNESFNQGSPSYRTAIAEARKQNIFVNTIFCGDRREGVELQWKNGADIGEGKYFSINSDEKVVNVATPFDDKLSSLNSKLNDTYISYGSLGRSKKENQTAQDHNAAKVSSAVQAERTVSKSKSSAYNNSNWDLVDKVKSDSSYLNQAKDDDLPAELKGKSLADRQKYINAKTAERESLQKQIGQLALDRKQFIDKAIKSQKGTDDLGKAIESSVLSISAKNGFTQAK